MQFQLNEEALRFVLRLRPNGPSYLRIQRLIIAPPLRDLANWRRHWFSSYGFRWAFIKRLRLRKLRNGRFV